MWFSPCIAVLLWLVPEGLAAWMKTNEYQVEPDTETLLKKWNLMEDLMLGEADILVKYYEIIFNRTVQDREISEECQQDIRFFLNDFKQLRRWAVKMYDANGKLSGSEFRGTFSSLGSFDECLNLNIPNQARENKSHGKYCLVDFRVPLGEKPRNLERAERLLINVPRKTEFGEDLANDTWYHYGTGYRFAVCLPSSCEKQDVGYFAKTVAARIGWISTVHSCETKQSVWSRVTTDQLVISCFLVGFVFLVLIASCVQSRNCCESVEKDSNIIRYFLPAFSIRDNYSKLTVITPNQDQNVGAIHGLRLLCTFWVLVGHTFAFTDIYLISHGKSAAELLTKFEFQLASNSFLAVDCFVFVTGVLVSYTCIQKIDKKDARLLNFPLMFFRRAYRLLAPCLPLIGIVIIMPLFGSGPTWWDSVGTMADNCRRNWWTNVLFFNNYLQFQNMCLPNTWYLSLDIQLYALALVYLYISTKSSGLAKLFLVVALVGSTACSVLLTYLYEDPPTIIVYKLNMENGNEQAIRTYSTTHNHIGIFCISLFIGTHMARHCPEKLSRGVIFTASISAAIGAVGCLFGVYRWTLEVTPPLWEGLLYTGLHRIVWAIALSWLIIYCRSSPESILNRALSWKNLCVVNRMTYAVYLINVPLIIYYGGNLRVTLDLNGPSIVWLLMAHTAMSFIASFWFKLLFEGPLLEAERLFFQYVSMQSIKIEKITKDQRELDNASKTNNTRL